MNCRRVIEAPNLPFFTIEHFNSLVYHSHFNKHSIEGSSLILLLEYGYVSHIHKGDVIIKSNYDYLIRGYPITFKGIWADFIHSVHRNPIHFEQYLFWMGQ